MTSVKDFRVEEEPTATDLGRGRFVFSDRYSVFDWGEMPDHIPNKGASLCLMGAYNFELLDVNHVPTHYLGVVEDGEVKDLGECESPPTEMAIELTQVPDLPHEDGEYDYDAYHEVAGENYLIPLEIVFRNTVPVGSSLRKRGEPADYGLDFDEWPDEPVDLPQPVVEFSTKYEEQDRYLARDEADEIAGVVDLDQLEELALAVNHILTERAAKAGFSHEDGKIECLYHDGTVKVADVVGTFDENRFSYDGQQVSKEVVRQYYKRVQPDWVDAVSAAKQEAIETGEPNWRDACEVEPENLPDEIVTALSDVYCAGTNAYVDYDWFDAPSIEDAVARVRDLN
ncbi:MULTISPECIES: phosphoribosylaminoimidazolesuccinocarboxamide synthase [Haloferax]|uniref:Phosphoribosylaminoimidazole-succinocarboxamide synthase n=1 Tax=Haloferax marinum TaxID=2666143 RepID=A0A6A8G8Y3_9EURY|nr:MULTISPECIES: phosphoribosylaminoimidazolesuccinocarboxamide synthase [Haloferax]KAB1198256.1 phosphoribosylaminoimidazolesuccinocarboxamide synthase [Haloferax sp. CBA1150]MRW97347.1 phosphoribosylaminoimidazolesuccinocarboxamide synthase [Haloferax marinum]